MISRLNHSSFIFTCVHFPEKIVRVRNHSKTPPHFLLVLLNKNANRNTKYKFRKLFLRFSLINTELSALCVTVRIGSTQIK